MTDEFRGAAREARLLRDSDALDQLDLLPSVTGIGSRAAHRRISGQVITVKLAAGKPPVDATPRHLCTTAIDMARPGPGDRGRATHGDRMCRMGAASCPTRRACAAYPA